LFNRQATKGVKMSAFQKAKRILTNPTIAITGPTGSGKTFSAMRLATGISKAMNKRFAVIDTENGSASLYSDLFDFDTLNITPPFTTEKYINAINLAEKEGYCALIIDSITHAWAGEGGLLEQKAQLDARPGSNHWTNWNPIKKKDLQFRNAYLHSSIPFLIATIRSKMEYQQTEDNGKKKVQKMGMAPVQSDGIEYEFSLVLDCAMNHECEVSKDRTHIFNDRNIFLVTEDVGVELVNWRSSAKEIKPIVENNELKKISLDELEDALSLETDYDFGEFVMPIGSIKGKTLNEIDSNKLLEVLNWIEVELKKVPPSENISQLFEVKLNIKNYLNAKG
jgi:hypothetical protein